MKLRSLALFAFVLTSTAFAQTIDGKPEVREDVLKTMTTKISTLAFVPGADFTKWETFLAKERAKIDEAKTDDEFKFAVNTALRNFGFSHIFMFSPKDVNTRRTGTTVGVGIQTQAAEDGRVIVRVVPESPAEKAGLAVGDTIIEVDGKKLTEVTQIAGNEGTVVKLKVRRSTGKIFEFAITRRPFSTVRKDTLTWINPATAVLKVNTFERGYDAKLINELMTDAVKAKNLVIDLRFNGGGAVTNLWHLSGYFIEQGLNLGYMIDKSSEARYEAKFEKGPETLQDLIPFAAIPMRPTKQAVRFTGNVAILINGGSGSASEIFTAAMRDNYGKHPVAKDGGSISIETLPYNATVIGTKSAGAVLFSTILEAAHGFNIQIPVADYLTPSGVRIEGNPIVPDVVKADPTSLLPGYKDEPIEAALSIFERIRLRNERTKDGN